MSEEKTVVVGGYGNIPGSKSMTCAKCGESIWIAPFGQRIIEEQNAEVWCQSCFFRNAPIATEVMPIADEQLDEMARVLGYRPDKEELRALIHRMLMKRYTPSGLD